MAVELEPITMPASMHVTVARTEAELDALRERWDELVPSTLDAHPDWLLALVAHRPETLRPHVVLIERPDRAPLMIVGRLERIPLESKIGYLTVAKPRVNCLFVGQGCVLGARDEADSRLVIDTLRGFLAAKEADLVALANVATDDPLYTLARTTPPWPCRDRSPHVEPRWTAAVPDSLDAFMQARSRKTAKNLKYYGNRLRKQHDVDVRLYTREEDLETVRRDLETVARNTYQRGMGVGFTGDDVERELMRLGMRNDWFRAWVVYLDGAPVAFWHGYVTGGRFGTQSPGFDPEFAKLSVGIFALGQMLETLCADERVNLLDFGSGDAEYKRSYSDGSVEEATLMMFATRPRAIAINLLRTAVGAVARLARRVASETGAGQKLKRAWRDRLAARAGS
jgi:hypothetical protein